MTKPRVVIIGGGFAGLTAARGLRKADVDVTLLDRTNHHLFQPLLYQVATAVLAPSDITSPIRWLLRKNTNTTVLLAEVDAIDPEKQLVHADKGTLTLPYDYLVIASGARHAYFGHDEWEPMAPGLKSLEDALKVRHRFLIAFEEAEKARRRIANRGCASSSWAAGPRASSSRGFSPTSRTTRCSTTSATSIRATRRSCCSRAVSGCSRRSSPDLAARALQDLQGLGVDVHLNAIVTRVEKDAVYVGEQRIPTRTVLWAAGNQASPLARTLDAPLDRAGRVLVAPDLSVPGHPHIFVTGDLAAINQENGELVPAVAPAANQMGKLAAKNIKRMLAELPTLKFKYRDKGNLATIGRYRAIAEIGPLKLRGQIAWWFWLFIHLMYLATFRNRVSVLIEWAYSYLTYQRGSRLLTEREGDGVSSAGENKMGSIG